MAAGLGPARLGAARQGQAWRGKTRQGGGWAGLGAARPGKARRNMARWRHDGGTAGRGPARCGAARRGGAKQGEEMASFSSNNMRWNMKATAWPSAESISKGQSLDPSDFGAKALSDGTFDRVELLKLKDEIEHWLALAGRSMSVVLVDDIGLRTLTDREAAHYHVRQQDLAVRRMHSHFGKLRSNVDQSKLCDADRERYQRDVALSALRSQALHKIRRLEDLTS